MNQLFTFLQSFRYWLALFTLMLLTEVVALYFQYGLGDEPCVLCIHVRLWVAALMLIAIIGMLTQRIKGLSLFIHFLAIAACAGLLERSWMTFGVERMFIDSSCAMFLGLPEWFAVDRWLPTVFEPRGICGDTPELLLGITMAEGLLVMSIGLLLTSVFAFLAVFRSIFR